jgi:hypothetical protein
MSVETELELLHGISAMTSAPWVLENWGMFEDWMNRLSFLVPEGRVAFSAWKTLCHFGKSARHSPVFSAINCNRHPFNGFRGGDSCWDSMSCDE